MTEIVLQVGIVVAAVVTGWFGVTAQREARKAQRESKQEESATTLEATRIVDREKLVTQQGQALDRLWTRVETLEREAEEDRARAVTDRERIEHLEHENADLRQHTVTCARDVEELREQLRDWGDRYRVAVVYVRKLHDWMAEHLPGDLKPPDPPEGLAFDLADPMHTEDPPPDGWPPRSPGPRGGRLT